MVGRHQSVKVTNNLLTDTSTHTTIDEDFLLMSQSSNLTNTCRSGFDCKSMTGFKSDNCPNFQICAQSIQLHRVSNYHTAKESLPYYFDYKNNALTVYRFLSPAAREAGWHVASLLPYRYEGDRLMVDPIDYYYEISETTRVELARVGWYPPQLLPWQIVSGFFTVVENFPEAGWGKPELLPYLKTEDGLYVGDIYYYDCVELGWAKACDLIAIYGLVIHENYCPLCASAKVMSAIFDDSQESYRSYHHCPDCLWSASIIPRWIEQNYFS